MEFKVKKTGAKTMKETKAEHLLHGSYFFLWGQ